MRHAAGPAALSRFAFAAIGLLLVGGCRSERIADTRVTGQIVEYGKAPSGEALRGIVYLPRGTGPFPVLLYAHGSAEGSLSDAAFEAVAPHFTSRGWAMFAPYRRGQGLSEPAGAFIGDSIAAARRSDGADRAQALLARLLATEQMDDQAKAFSWLARQGFADRRRIAAMGNSFGGVLALLSAERLPICAAVDAAGGAASWTEAPALRSLMTGAAVRARAPMLFIQAANDHTLAPSRTLHAARRRVGKPAAIRLYPPFGSGAQDGHAFAWRGGAVWGNDVHAFLEGACPPA